jgi:acetoin utilization protein AcuB
LYNHEKRETQSISFNNSNSNNPDLDKPNHPCSQGENEMLVKNRMSHPVITIHPELPIQDALKRMHEEGIRRFPVVDARGRLVGIIAESDLLHASPSEVTSLSVWELNYLLSKITVEKVMVQDVITVTEETPLEEAARIMVDNKIGALPVIRNNELVGIITETDLFKIFIEILGAREPGARLSVIMPNVPGELAKITKAIFELGGNIVALVTYMGESSENYGATFKIAGVPCQTLVSRVEPLVERVVDVRDCS